MGEVGMSSSRIGERTAKQFGEFFARPYNVKSSLTN